MIRSPIKKLLRCLICASLATLSAHAKSNRNPAAAQWDDPTFVNAFLGSYGFLADYEPQISNPERTVLRDLIEQIKASPAEAIQQLETQLKPSSSAAFDFILANLYFQNGQLAKAEAAYRTAIQKHPNFRRAYKNLGLLLVQNDDFKGAIPILSKAMELGEIDGRAYGLLGYAYLSQERFYPAEAAYRQAILMQPDVTDWKLGLGRCLLETQRHAEAITLLDTLIKDQPDNADYWLLQANAYLGNEQSLKAAQNIEVVRLMGKAQLATLTLLGDIYMNNQAPELALSAYLDAINIAKPQDRHALIRAAELLTRTRNFPLAQTLIEQTRAHYSTTLPETDDFKLLTLEAKIARAQGDDAKALAALNRIVAHDTLNGEALIELANYYADQDDLAKAITRYQQAEKIEAYERDALIAHAQTLVRYNKYQAAIPMLRRALQLKADNNLENYLQRVERAAREQ